MAAVSSATTDSLSDTSHRVLKFAAEKHGSLGLRYEDFMTALQGPLLGIDTNGLNAALHQLESGGFLRPDPMGTPGRRIWLTPKGRELSLGSAAAPTPAEAKAEAADPNEPRLKAGGPASERASAPTPAAPPVAAASMAAPAPSSSHPPSPPSSRSSGTMDDREKMLETRDEESRKRLKLVIEREDAVRASEEKLRTEEKRILGEEERLADLRKEMDKEKAEHAARVEEIRKALDGEKAQIEAEKARIRTVASTMERHRIELDEQEQRIKRENGALEEREKRNEVKTSELGEREKMVAEQEDSLHEHLTAVKGHLENLHHNQEGIQKVHDAVTANRAKRGKSA